MPRKPNPERVDHVNPELTQEWLAKALPASALMPGLFGEQASEEMVKPKERVSIRLDSDIVGAFEQSGPGWQARLNNALRDWLENHPIQKA